MYTAVYILLALVVAAYGIGNLWSVLSEKLAAMAPATRAGAAECASIRNLIWYRSRAFNFRGAHSGCNGHVFRPHFAIGLTHSKCRGWRRTELGGQMGRLAGRLRSRYPYDSLPDCSDARRVSPGERAVLRRKLSVQVRMFQVITT